MRGKELKGEDKGCLLEKRQLIQVVLNLQSQMGLQSQSLSGAELREIPCDGFA